MATPRLFIRRFSGATIEVVPGHIKWMEADGDPVPPPRSLEQICSDDSLAEDREDAVLVAIPLIRALGRQRGQTRSAFIASAVLKELTE